MAQRTDSEGVKERAEYADEAVRRGHAVPDWLLPKEDAKHRPPHIAIKDLTAALVRERPDAPGLCPRSALLANNVSLLGAPQHQPGNRLPGQAPRRGHAAAAAPLGRRRGGG